MIIIDIDVYMIYCRVPSVPVAELVSHSASLNSVCWAPQSSAHIATCADDKQALIWDVTQTAANKYTVEDPILAYTAAAEINNMQWDSSHEDWIAISYDKNVQILKV